MSKKLHYYYTTNGKAPKKKEEGDSGRGDLLLHWHSLVMYVIMNIKWKWKKGKEDTKGKNSMKKPKPLGCNNNQLTTNI